MVVYKKRTSEDNNNNNNNSSVCSSMFASVKTIKTVLSLFLAIALSERSSSSSSSSVRAAYDNNDRAGAFIGWHGEITRPEALERLQGEHQEEEQRQRRHANTTNTSRRHQSFVREQLVMQHRKPKPSHHASTIAETTTGSFLIAWFAGQFESKPDCAIYIARYQQHLEKFSEQPELVVPAGRGGIANWNPVLFKRSNGDVLLFYKQGKTPTQWRGFYKKSRDNGNTWSEQIEMPLGVIGPAKNKPLELDDGTLLLPSSREFGVRGKDWEIVVEGMTVEGEFKTYARIAVNEKGSAGQIQQRVIQPVFWKQSPSIDSQQNGEISGIRMFARSRSSYVVAAVGDSTGRIWTDAVYSQIPCPNTGFDVVKLRDGRLLIIYNHSFKHAIAGRGVLSLAISYDDGDTWEHVMRLEDSAGRLLEFSYPAIIQASDGLVHATYTWRRANIKHVIIDPAKIPTQSLNKRKNFLDQGGGGVSMLGGFEKLPRSISREV